MCVDEFDEMREYERTVIHDGSATAPTFSVEDI